MRGTLGFWARTACHSLEDIGLQPLKLLGLRALPGYVGDLARYRRLRRRLPHATGAALQLAPLFSDRYAGAGAWRSLYFLQDLLYSSRVLSQPSCRHFDVGFRMDGFVAQIAASWPIEVLDTRPREQPPRRDLRFLQEDILDSPEGLKS
jgi:hypothetical protein